MQVIKGRPVNYAEILKVFPLASNPGVIFAYAPDIYCPSGKPLPESLLVHEAVHIERQTAMGVEAWWDKYLTDLQFRYIEELLAHRAEYDNLIGSPNAPRNVRSRQQRTRRRFVGYMSPGMVGYGSTLPTATRPSFGWESSQSTRKAWD